MSLEKTINDAWEIKDQISPSSDKNLKDAIIKASDEVINGDFNNFGIESKYLSNYNLFNNKSIFVIGSKVYISNNCGRCWLFNYRNKRY